VFVSFCPACLTDLPDEARFCGACGFMQAGPRAAAEQRFELPRILSPDAPVQGAMLDDDEPDEEMSIATNPGELAWATTERGGVPAHRRHQPPRRLRRFTLRGEASVSGERLLIQGAVENISTGGVFVVADDELPVIGTELDVQFRLPTHEAPYQVRAVVAWLRPANERSGHNAGFGLRFLALPPEIEAAILVFIQHRDPRCFGSP
jgi:uncharacterized protein (TIGR02266 family)